MPLCADRLHRPSAAGNKAPFGIDPGFQAYYRGLHPSRLPAAPNGKRVERLAQAQGYRVNDKAIGQAQALLTILATSAGSNHDYSVTP